MLVGLGLGRVVAGVLLLAFPDRAGQAWAGRGGRTAAGQTFVRAVGARDLALGAGLLVAHRRGDDEKTWLAGGVLADGADLAATLAAGSGIPARGRLGVVAAAGSGIASGLYLSFRRD